jgi:hypothetical protein
MSSTKGVLAFAGYFTTIAFVTNLFQNFQSSCFELEEDDESLFKRLCEKVNGDEGGAAGSNGGSRARNNICYYFTNNRHPLLLLSPAKVELISVDPEIKLYHDVLTSGEMRTMRRLARPKVKAILST